MVIYAPIESPSQFDWENFILKIFGSDSDEKNPEKIGLFYISLPDKLIFFIYSF